MALTERLAILLETVGVRRVVSDFGSVGDAADKLHKETANASSGMAGLGASALSAGTLLKGAAVAALGVAAKQVGDFAMSTIDAASSFEEASNKSAVVFGANADRITQWARQAATNFGLSQTAATEAAATFGNMFAAMGVGATTSLNMSRAIVELASDVASFNNIPIPDVLDRLRSGLLGEQEAVERLGINMSETRLKAVALNMGLGDGKSVLDANAKAMAAYQIIMEDTTNAQGDFDRTSGSLANQQRTLQANWENMQTELGQKLLPVMTQLVTWLNTTGIPAFVNFANVIGGGISDAIGQTLGAVADLLSLVGKTDKIFPDFAPLIGDFGKVSKDLIKELRDAESGLYDFELNLDGLADTATGTNGALQATTGQLADFGKTAGQSSKDIEATAAAAVELKDAQFALRDAQRSSEDAARNLANAQDDLNELIASGGIDLDQVTAAQEKYARAQQDTADALSEVEKWQTAVNDALTPADSKTKARADRDLAEAQDEVTMAGIELRDAQNDLLNINRDGRVSADEYREAQLRVREAERNLQQVTEDLTEAEYAHGEVNRLGTTATEAYKTAAEGLKAAQDDAKVARDAETAAQLALNETLLPAAGYSDALATAELRVEDAAWRVEKAAWAAEKAQMAFNAAVAPDKQAAVDGMTSSVAALNTELDYAAQPRTVGLTGGQAIGAAVGGMFPATGGGLGGWLRNAIPVPNMNQAAAVVNVTVNGDVMDPTNLWSRIHEGLLGLQRRNGSLGFR